ncbi:pitrilysin family protein [Pelagibius sp. Alg239-R121]|uniref:M16 family metallopeptidase n=1 Tax=Pelagibius sp. Alg239-R121 TaxID=2993448 RepID=UPI0024A774C8|nr:pitrilysin family protein [Pelagibius sp. Alg239-R121]
MMKNVVSSLAVSVAVVFLTAAPANAVEIERVVSPGGIEAWLVQDHRNPIIAMEFAFKGGAAQDPADKAGLSGMTAALIDEGAGELDSQGFRGLMDENSIGLSFDAGRDEFSGSLRSLTETKDLAFNLMRLALTSPRFDEEAVARIRSQIMVGLAQRKESPDAIAGKTLRALFFGDHPYGQATEGTMESVPAITVEDMQALVRERFALDRLKIAVVGDLTPEELATLLDRTFGGLRKTSSLPPIPDTEVMGTGDLVVVDKNLPQSVVSFGHQGIKRSDPDYYAAYVVNYVLGGGGMSSRLYEEIREKRGLAYSVYSYLNPLDHASLIGGGVATQNARVSETLDILRAEWKRMADAGLSAEDLADAKTFLTGSFPLRLSGSDRIAGMMLGMQIQGLGIDYLDMRNSYIEAVTLEQAQRVARELFKPEALTVVVVGRPENVKATRPAPDGAS